MSLGFSFVSGRTELALVCPRSGQCPLPNLPISGHCGGEEGPLPQPQGVPSEVSDHVPQILVSWSLPCSGTCHVGLALTIWPVLLGLASLVEPWAWGGGGGLRAAPL